MRTKICLLMMVVLGFCGVAAEKGAKAGYSQEGIWKPVGAVASGARLPKKELDKITLAICENYYEVTVIGEKEQDRGTFKVDESVTPKRITLVSTNGPNRGKTILGIYEMKDDKSMRVCYDLSGVEFPKEFKAPKGTHLFLAGYRRQGSGKSPVEHK